MRRAGVFRWSVASGAFIVLQACDASAQGRSAPVHGVVVVARAGATDAAWPLAQSVYASPTLRPSIDEASARALCGEPLRGGEPPEVQDLAADVAAVRGEDAASKAVLADIARRSGALVIVVVSREGPASSARLFLPQTGVFDAATYAPDPGSSTAWTGATESIRRTYGAAEPIAAPAPPLLATHALPAPERRPDKAHAFYESPWFWGALGAAAAAGAAVYLTHDNGSTMLHLQMNVNH